MSPVFRLGPGYSLLVLCLGAVLGAAAFWGANYVVQRTRQNAAMVDPEAKLRETTPKQPLDPDEREAVELFKKVKPSVVNVDLVQVQRNGGWDESLTERQTSAGSGFIWDRAGRIVTNYHVISDITTRPGMMLRVVMADRTAYDAVLIGISPDDDLAVLQFAPHNRPPADKLSPIELGTSHNLEVGEKVYAIGNPFGLSLTMTKGIISALERSIESPARTAIPGIIQTDAAINPGNSGGPLLDKSGRLIGVNTAIASSNGGNVGIGFAIPVDSVNQVVTQIIQSGRVLRPDLGIRLYDQRRLRQARYDHGVMIAQVAPNGPAAKAGLLGIRVSPRSGRPEPGDLIIAINGRTIDSIDDYEREMQRLKPGEQAVLKIVRKEEEQDVPVTVGGA